MTNLQSLEQIVTVSNDTEVIMKHSYDWWPVATKWRQQGKQPYKPDIVAYPNNIAEISEVLRWVNEHHVAVTPWGAGSSVGASLPLNGGITLNLSRMTRTLAIDTHNLMVTVETGKMGHDLETELNAKGYTLNHSPQSLSRSTVGGWVATRATGQFSSRYGGIEDMVIALTVVLPSGEVIHTKQTPRAAIGTDLKHVFIGSEGTLGVVAEVTLKIFALAEYRRFEAIQFNNLEAGVHTIRDMIQVGLRPFLVRYYDEDEAKHAMKDAEFNSCVMFLGFEGDQAVANAEYDTCETIWSRYEGAPLGSASVEAWMNRRFDFSTVENILAKPGGVAETIEVSHFWNGIVDTYHLLKEALAPLASEVLGHFSHVYPQGSSLYMILLGEVGNASEAEARILKIWDVSMEICLQTGAALSHHHGAGLARLPYMQRELGDSRVALQLLKKAFDPNNILSPGKFSL